MPPANPRKSWSHATQSRHLRGYGTDWDKIRPVVLNRDMYLCQCEECKRTGRVTPANQVDHIIPKAQGGTNDLENLRAVNVNCHKRITDEQLGRRERPRIGVNGYPEGWGS